MPSWMGKTWENESFMGGNGTFEIKEMDLHFLQGGWVNMAMSEGNLRTFDEKLDGEDASFDERRWTVVGKMTSFIEGFEMVTLTGK